jgi:glycosyltransferase involved in cell wall biosynthesis
LEVNRLLFIVSEDWYFVSHRLHLAIAAVQAGFRVGVLTHVSSHRQRIEDAGVEVLDWNLNRRSRNPFIELRAIGSVVRALRRFRPDLIHAVALKPVLYSSLASRIVGLRRRVFAMGGLGFAFASERWIARLLRPMVVRILRLALAGSQTRLILQNPYDLELLTSAGVIDAERVRLIRGAGVDTVAFQPQPERAGSPLVILPARMLWDKGVAEFVSCAVSLKRSGVRARFALVGEPDPHNPECVPESQLRQWSDSGVVEWWGRRDDMPAVFSKAHIVCLPTTYGEGLPKALLEAASCAKPIVTFDVPGCREIVIHGDNGLLVPLRDVGGLVEAVSALISDPVLREKMGSSGRSKVLREFSEELIAAETLNVWRELLT